MNKIKAIFLDRDGVINDNTNFVNTAEDLKIYPWVYEALKIFRECGYKIFIVTNQGGIELGYMTETDLDEIHSKMKKELEQNNVYVDDIVYCPHYYTQCDCRKPKPGMILKLAEVYNIDLKLSWMIGDMDSDIEAGKSAECNTIKITPNLSKDDISYMNLLEAAKIIQHYEEK